MSPKLLFERLGSYEGITAFADNLLPRLQGDSQLGRFWEHRGDDDVAREKQLLVAYLGSCAGGPMYYTGRDMRTSHKGMRISEDDWSTFMQHAAATMAALKVPGQEQGDVAAFVSSLKVDIVEA